MNLKEFIEVTTMTNNTGLRPIIHCNDGFEISVQASSGHYCMPKEVTNDYTLLELGYPNKDEELIKGYAANKNILTNTVYPFTPFDLVNNVIEKHGGINVAKTFS